MARVAVVTVAFLIAISCLGLPSNHDSGNETSAIVMLKSIGVAQVAYRTTCGNGAYASSLAALAAPPGGSGDGFIDKEFASSPAPEKTGYRFSMTAGAGSAAGPLDCNGTPTITKFYASAVPVANDTGSRSFAVNQTNIVWNQSGRTAPAEPFGPPAWQVQ